MMEVHPLHFVVARTVDLIFRKTNYKQKQIFCVHIKVVIELI